MFIVCIILECRCGCGRVSTHHARLDAPDLDTANREADAKCGAMGDAEAESFWPGAEAPGIENWVVENISELPHL